MCKSRFASLWAAVPSCRRLASSRPFSAGACRSQAAELHGAASCAIVASTASKWDLATAKPKRSLEITRAIADGADHSPITLDTR